MEELYQYFDIWKRQHTYKKAINRPLLNKIDWSNRCIAIIGSRGVGKTTLLAHQLLITQTNPGAKALYISLDNLYFSSHSIIETATQFVQHGGTHLFIDEVHKYPNWSQEIKNIYDLFSDLNLILTGSSILELYKGETDLSRRMVSYKLHGFSFREFLHAEGVLSHDQVSFEELINNHNELTFKINSETNILPIFSEYLKIGYYPFYLENKKAYAHKLANTINQVMEIDIPAVEKLEAGTSLKMKKLLYLLSQETPFQINTTKLSQKLETTRGQLLKILSYLERAQLLLLLKSSSTGDSVLTKPEKTYLNNTNLMYALNLSTKQEGNTRETFFFNMLQRAHKINHTKQGDFLIDDTYTIEVGGKNKSMNQIKDILNSFVAADNIETGYQNKIPLWLFGFLD